ncbi:MAG: sulfatase-like hydrolase/transferase [Phycisphaerae bacterium]
MRLLAVLQLALTACAWAQGGFNTPGACWDGFETANKSAPNVWVIVMDDNDYDAYGHFGDAAARTPNLDYILGNSVVFRNCYVPMSVCRPSLAALLSGKYPERSGVRNNGSVEVLRASETIAHALSNDDYMTFLGGKFWETRGGTPADYGFRCVESGGLQQTLDAPFARSTQAKFLEMITETQGAWFAFWTPMLPHTPYDAPQQFVDQININDIDVPAWVNDLVAYRAHVRLYLANLAWLDAKIGEGLAALVATGQIEETIIITLADNGLGFGHYSKQSPFDKGLRTHLSFMRLNHYSPQHAPDLVSSVDVVPTMADLCGIARPAFAQGLSLAPRILSQTTTPARDQISGAVYSNGTIAGFGTGVVPAALWTRTPTHKYIKFLVPVNSTTLDPLDWQLLFSPVPNIAPGTEMLFDIAADPFERNDLSGTVELAALLVSLRTQSADWFAAQVAAGQDPPDPCVPRSADLNFDSFVNLTDLSILLSNFGVPGEDAAGNLNCDLDVNISDLAILLAQFGV